MGSWTSNQSPRGGLEIQERTTVVAGHTESSILGNRSVGSSTIVGEAHSRRQHPQLGASIAVKHVKYDAISLESFEGNGGYDQLRPDETANGRDFNSVQVPEGAPANLLCEECERRCAVAKCKRCDEVLCAPCLAILHIPSAGGQAHPDLAQGSIRKLREKDDSSVKIVEDDHIPAQQVDEDEMAIQRDLTIPSSLDAPSIDLMSRIVLRNSSSPLHAKGQLVIFDASLADSLPDSLCDVPCCNGDCDDGCSWRLPRPHELYGEVMSVPFVRHGEWGHAGRRAQGHRLMVRVKVLSHASRSYSEPFVEEWLRRNHRDEAPREPVVITGGGGADPLSTGISAARVKDRQREAIKKSLAPPENELPMVPPPCGEPGLQKDLGKTGRSFPGVTFGVTESLVVLVPEHELFTVGDKREQLRRQRSDFLEACRQGAERRQNVASKRVALEKWHNFASEIRHAKREWASGIVQKRTRGALVRLRMKRQHEAKEKARWEAGRRLHRRFHYLTPEERRKKARGGITTDGRVFLETKAQVCRLEDLRRTMALRAFRILCKGAYHAKERAFKHFKHLTEYERRGNEPFIFSVANDASLAGDEVEAQRSLMTVWRYPTHGITLPPLLPVHPRQPGSFKEGQPLEQDAVAMAKVARKMAGPTSFCSWLIPGSVLMSSYLDAEVPLVMLHWCANWMDGASLGCVEPHLIPRGSDIEVLLENGLPSKARPRDFKQPLYPDAAAQMMLAGVGTLVALSSEEEVRKHESEKELVAFDEAFELRHGLISADVRHTMSDAAQDVATIRQEEKNVELLRYVEDYNQEERRKKLADVVDRMRTARATLTRAQQVMEVLPKKLEVVWDGLPEDETPQVAHVIELVVGLEDRLRAGEKLCLWSPRGHGRVGLVGAVLLGRLYGCTAEEALLRVQMCHDARESLKDRPQISCPETILQVQCARESLLRTSSMYADLTMRAGLPVSTKGIKVRKFARGEGPPSLRDSIRVPEETHPNRYEREREHRRQVEIMLDEHQPALLLPPADENTTHDYRPSRGVGVVCEDGDMSNKGSIHRPVMAVPWRGIPVTAGDEPRPPMLEEGGYRSGTLRRLRVTPAVPYPTMRSLRLQG